MEIEAPPPSSLDEALHELDDSEHIDVRRVETIMSEIGYELNDKVVEAADAQLKAGGQNEHELDPELLAYVPGAQRVQA